MLTQDQAEEYAVELFAWGEKHGLPVPETALTIQLIGRIWIEQNIDIKSEEVVAVGEAS